MLMRPSLTALAKRVHSFSLSRSQALTHLGSHLRSNKIDTNIVTEKLKRSFNLLSHYALFIFPYKEVLICKAI